MLRPPVDDEQQSSSTNAPTKTNFIDGKLLNPARHLLASIRPLERQLGPLISQKRFDRITGCIASGKSKGADVATGGQRSGTKGVFIQPIILFNPSADAKVIRKEISRPVLIAMPFEDVDAAPRAAKQQSLWSGRCSPYKITWQAHVIARGMRSGPSSLIVTALLITRYLLSDYKQSGWGREGDLQGVEAFLGDEGRRRSALSNKLPKRPVIVQCCCSASKVFGQPNSGRCWCFSN